MKQEVERELGFTITEEQFRQSEKRAKNKLSTIISQFGDADGARCEPAYLIDLIYEDVKADIFSNATLLIRRQLLDIEIEHLTKSECP